MLNKIIVLALCLIFLNLTHSQNLRVRIEIPKDSGNFTDRDLTEFIEEARQNMLSELLTNNMKKKAVMILGLSGTGKSTLVNYLIGLPLICKRIGRKWVIELANINNEGQRIGHTSRSETFYPSAYSTINSDFSFIDTPGIKDNRGISVEIANAFFRQEVLKDVDELKFVLLLTYHDIYDRGDQFRASIKALTGFLGIFDESDVHSKISSSIGIVVTKVENDGETDEEMIKGIRERLNEILNGAKEANEFKFEEKVYRNILIKSNIQIFSNPKFFGRLKDFQQKNILNMIENLDYIAKRHVKIRMSVEAKYFEQLFEYIESNYKRFEVIFRERIKSALIQYYDKNERDLIYINKTIEVYINVIKLKQLGNKSLKLKEFLGQCSEFFNQSDVDAILIKQTLIEFYSFLLKNETREKFFSFQRVWLDTHLMENIEMTLNRILNYFNNQFKDFNNMIQNKTIEALSVFYKTKKAITRDASDAANLYQALDELNKNGTKLNSIESFLKKLAEAHVFKKEQVQAILNKKNALQNLIDLLPNERKVYYAFRKEWVTTQISSNISMYLDDITSFLQTKFDDIKVSFGKSLEIELKKYFKNAINASISIEDIRQIEKILNQFKSIALKELSIQDVITNISESIMSKSIKDQVYSRRAFNEFIEILPNEKAKYFEKKRNWIGPRIDVFTQNLLDELKLFYSESVKDYLNGTLTVNGHFGNLSNVLNYIKSSDYINDLKTVRVYTTNSFLLDEDYLVLSGKYKEHSPDLIIISPYVSFAKKITIDLSCQITPDFPGRKSKADDGWAAGEAGDDGQPGLPGCNGGDLLIIADTISINTVSDLKNDSLLRQTEFISYKKITPVLTTIKNDSLIGYLNFTSNGGKGGPGQSGGNGRNGRNGRDGDFKNLDFRNKNVDGDYCTERSNKYVCIVIKSEVNGAHWNKVFRSYGEDGQDGGNAGKGGSGGLGGLGGILNVIAKQANIDKQQFTVIDGNFVHTAKNGKNGTLGRSGDSGKPGDGGSSGRIAQRTVTAVYMSGPSIRNEYIHPSERFKDGKISKELNSNSIIGPFTVKKLQKYDRQTEYLFFISKFNEKFNYTSLLDRHSLKSIMELGTSKPRVDMILNRVQTVTSLSNKNLLDHLKQELLNLYKNEDYNEEEKKVLKYSLAVVISSINRLFYREQEMLVVDFKSYLDITIEHIGKWTSLAKLSVRDAYKTNYENNLKKKIDQANYSINVLNDDIKAKNEKIKSSIADSLNEIKKLRNATLEEKQFLEAKRRELQSLLAMEKFFGVMSIAAQTLSFLGPKGALVGSMINAGTSIAGNLINNPIKTVTVAPATNAFINNYKDHLEKQNKINFDKMTKDIEVLEKRDEVQFKRKSLKEQSIEIKIDNLSDSPQKYALKMRYLEYQYFKIGSNDNQKKIENENKMKEAEKKLKAENEKVGKTTENLKKVSTALDTARVVNDVYRDVVASQDEISEIENQIANNAQTLNALYDMENKINEYQRNLFIESQKELNEFAETLKSNSLPMLTHSRWKIKEMLEEIKKSILDLVGGFPNQKFEIENTIARLENSFSTMVEIYSHNERYSEQIEFATFISDITNPKINVNVPIEHQSKVNEIEKTILSNVIAERYEQALEAFKYWSFPFFCAYTNGINIYDLDSSSSIDEKVKGYVETLSKFRDKFNKYKAVLIPSIHNYIQNEHFKGDNSFYNWTSSMFPFEIKQLLSGEMVTLYADIKQSRFDAIKFCTINLVIDIKSTNANSSQLLNNLLNEFYVELTHSGVSYYKYLNDVYVINLNYNSGEQLLLRFPYGSAGNHSTASPNESYKRLAVNEPVLSPYTFWQIKLAPINSMKKEQLFRDIENLISAKDDIIVSLNGYGQFIHDTSKMEKPNCKAKRASESAKVDKHECATSKQYKKQRV